MRWPQQPHRGPRGPTEARTGESASRAMQPPPAASRSAAGSAHTSARRLLDAASSRSSSLSHMAMKAQWAGLMCCVWPRKAGPIPELSTPPPSTPLWYTAQACMVCVCGGGGMAS
jgi:hypothetical protein